MTTEPVAGDPITTLERHLSSLGARRDLHRSEAAELAERAHVLRVERAELAAAITRTEAAIAVLKTVDGLPVKTTKTEVT